MPFRKEKLASLLKRIIREYLFLHFPPGREFTTITRIDLSPNFKKAVIFVTIDPEEQSEKILKKLQKTLPAIRKDVASKITIKFIPSFECRIDKGEKNRARIEELIEKLSAENRSSSGRKKK